MGIRPYILFIFRRFYHASLCCADPRKNSYSSNHSKSHFVTLLSGPDSSVVFSRATHRDAYASINTPSRMRAPLGNKPPRTSRCGQRLCQQLFLKALNDSLNALYVWFPSSVWTSVWVRNFDAKFYILTTEITFCHFPTPPCDYYKMLCELVYNNRKQNKMQYLFANFFFTCFL